MLFLHFKTVTICVGDACRAFSAAALAAGLPALLNEVRRVLLTLQLQQAEAAVAQLHALALEMEAVGSVAAMRRALLILQQQPKLQSDLCLNAESENESAMLLQQAWHTLCSAAVASSVGGCTSGDCEACVCPPTAAAAQ